MLEKIIFFIFSAITLVSAWAVVTQRNLIRAALCLMAALAGVAGLFALLEAGFLALVQIFVYFGGIALIIVFAAMLTRRVMDPDTPQKNTQWAASVGLVLVLFVLLALILWPDPIKVLPETDISLKWLLYPAAIVALALLGVEARRQMSDADSSQGAIGRLIILALVIVVGMWLVWDRDPRLQIHELTLGDIPWPEREADVDADSLTTLGEALVDSEGFVVPFEAASVLLLVAMIGAAYIAFPSRDEPEAEPEPAGAELAGEPGGEESL